MYYLVPTARVLSIGLNVVLNIVTSEIFVIASSSVKPTVASGGELNTAAGMFEWSGTRGLFPKKVSAKQCPS